MRNRLWFLQRVLLLQAVALLSANAQYNGHSISGSAGLANVSVRLSGAQTLSTTASSQGNYRFHGLNPGTYTVTPALSGYTFTPSSRSVTMSTTSIESVSFTANAVTRKETGLIASPASVTLSSIGATGQLKVEATYSDESSVDVTSTSTYASSSTSIVTVSQTGRITGVGKGSAKIIASYGGFASNVNITVNNPVATYSISGLAGAGAVTVTLSGPTTGKTVASSDGAYAFSNLPVGTYTITPTLTGYKFSPASQSKTITNANLSAVNFTATASTPHLVDLTWNAGSIPSGVTGRVVVGYNVYRGSVSGGPYTQINASPVAGLTYTDTAVSAGQSWFYVCSTVDSAGSVSAHSNQASAQVP
jgi:hypothetical protein